LVDLRPLRSIVPKLLDVSTFPIIYGGSVIASSREPSDRLDSKMLVFFIATDAARGAAFPFRRIIFALAVIQ
jgi:hypothetical protein